jgi:hypothetical protein
MMDNMKYMFLKKEFVKIMFLRGASALFWGRQHQNQTATLP